MKKLVIVLSGKKQSGKSSTANYILSKYLNMKIPSDPPDMYGVDEKGNLTFQERVISVDKIHRAKLFSFADSLKEFCMNVFGVPHEACYGTDAEKNTPVPHLLWENVPNMWRPATYDIGEGKAGEDFVNPPKLKTGPMTGREIMQLFGTEICRTIDADCWARGTYNIIASADIELALVPDARFPNEITMGEMVEAKTIRLLRDVYQDNHHSELALDNFPQEKYSLVLDNTHMTLKQQCEALDPVIDHWFQEVGII